MFKNEEDIWNKGMKLYETVKVTERKTSEMSARL